MKAYRVEVNRYESERQELANAEKLFDLPITMYPDLQQVQKQMKGLEMIYALYEEQLVFKFDQQLSLPFLRGASKSGDMLILVLLTAYLSFHCSRSRSKFWIEHTVFCDYFASLKT